MNDLEVDKLKWLGKAAPDGYIVHGSVSINGTECEVEIEIDTGAGYCYITSGRIPKEWIPKLTKV